MKTSHIFYVNGLKVEIIAILWKMSNDNHNWFNYIVSMKYLYPGPHVKRNPS